MKLVLEFISLRALLLARQKLHSCCSPVSSLTTESPTKGRPQRQCWKAFRDLSLGVGDKRQDRWVTSQAGLAIRTGAVTLAPEQDHREDDRGFLRAFSFVCELVKPVISGQAVED